MLSLEAGSLAFIQPGPTGPIAARAAHRPPSAAGGFARRGRGGAASTAAAVAAALAVSRRRSATVTVARQAEAAEPEVVDDGEVDVLDQYSDMRPYGGYQEPPARIFEGTNEIDLSKKESRPAGSSEEGTYFWKMTQDKRFIEVIIPVDDSVEANDVIYRMGEEPEEVQRGPTLELGYRTKNEDGKVEENLIIDGQILNAIRREESFWILDEMVGVKVIILTLSRPRMRRQRHDPILRRKTEEERIEPQTWDALLVEDRLKPKVTHKVFMDIELEGKAAGRMEFGLFGDLLPKTVDNFRGLCNGEYSDEEGNTKQSAFCYKGSKFSNIMGQHIISAGNAGKDLELIEFSPEELAEYYEFFKDFEQQPKTIGKVLRGWVLRWGGSLGLGEDIFGTPREEGQATDNDSNGELKQVVEIMGKLVEKGEGAKLWFYKPEWEKGCDVTGGTFQAEGFKVTHRMKGMLTMDRHETQDYQGSVFFITLKEFPQMDNRWVCFGEILSGMELLEKIEDEYEGRAKMVKIADCGDLPLED